MRLLKLFSRRVRKKRRGTKTEIKVAIIAFMGAIAASAIPVMVNGVPKSGNINLIGLHVSRYSYGLSTIAVLDLQLENSGEKAVRITEVKLKIEKIFRFDAPLPPLVRIPATGSYHVSLA